MYTLYNLIFNIIVLHWYYIFIKYYMYIYTYIYIYIIIYLLYLANNEASEMQSPQQLTFLKSRLVLPVTTYSKSTTKHITLVNNGLPTSQSGK